MGTAGSCALDTAVMTARSLVGVSAIKGVDVCTFKGAIVEGALTVAWFQGNRTI
jgi:hypothetical protein